MIIPQFLLTALPLISSYYPKVPEHHSPRTIVSLRVEGQHQTLFEGYVYTWPHDVDPELGGKHRCDGTNADRNPKPGPTVTGTLDNAAMRSGFTWDGDFFPEFDDYLVKTIDSETSTDKQYWGSVLNYESTKYGGCQVQVKYRDEVMWAMLNTTGDAHFLKLSGPITAHVNKTVTVTVTNGATGDPVAGADVDGEKSDEEGRVSLVFDSAGIKGVKAEKKNSVRSNRHTIIVV